MYFQWFAETYNAQILFSDTPDEHVAAWRGV